MFALLASCTPDLPAPPDLASARPDPARGAYLADHVLSCRTCHSHRDWSMLYAPDTSNHPFAGSDTTLPVLDLPPNTILWSANLTPHRPRPLVRRRDRPRHRVGPGPETAPPCSRSCPTASSASSPGNDLASIVAYLRTLDPAPDETEARSLPFPLNVVVRGMPKPAALRDRPPPRDTAAYGGYLATAASCVWCHSPRRSTRATSSKGARCRAPAHRFPLPPPAASPVLSPPPDPRSGGHRRVDARAVRRALPGDRSEPPPARRAGRVQHADAVDSPTRA